ncbi:hypothetical protein ACFRFC_01370 [Streptomyces sp. NPDC056734]
MASFSALDWSHRSALYSHLHMIDYQERQPLEADEVDHQLDRWPERTRFATGNRLLPWNGTDPVFYASHGDPGALGIPQSDGSEQELDPRAGAAFVRSLTAALRPTRPLVMLSCYSGALSGRADPLAEPPIAQHVANETGRRVWAATSSTGVHHDISVDIWDSVSGPGAFVDFVPDPAGANLDQLASGPLRMPPDVDPSVRRTYALRLSRLLRYALGTQVERDPHYQSLATGLAAVDRLRPRERSFRDGPMTLPLLRAITAAVLGGPGADRVTDDDHRELFSFTLQHLTLVPTADLHALARAYARTPRGISRRQPPTSPQPQRRPTQQQRSPAEPYGPLPHPIRGRR